MCAYMYTHARALFLACMCTPTLPSHTHKYLAVICFKILIINWSISFAGFGTRYQCSQISRWLLQVSSTGLEAPQCADRLCRPTLFPSRRAAPGRLPRGLHPVEVCCLQERGTESIGRLVLFPFLKCFVQVCRWNGQGDHDEREHEADRGRGSQHWQSDRTGTNWVLLQLFPSNLANANLS